MHFVHLNSCILDPSTSSNWTLASWTRSLRPLELLHLGPVHFELLNSCTLITLTSCSWTIAPSSRPLRALDPRFLTKKGSQRACLLCTWCYFSTSPTPCSSASQSRIVGSWCELCVSKLSILRSTAALQKPDPSSLIRLATPRPQTVSYRNKNVLVLPTAKFLKYLNRYLLTMANQMA